MVNPIPLPFSSQEPLILIVLMVWTVVWKGLALFRSARIDQKYWFVLFLVVNTFGILEIGYLFFFAREKMKISELKFWENFRIQKKSK